MNKSVRPKNTVGDVYFRYSLSTTKENDISQHCHDGYEILYVIDGSGKYVIEGAEYQIKPRTVLFAPPFSYHSLQLDIDSQYERYVLQFFVSVSANFCRTALSASLPKENSRPSSGNFSI